MYVTEILYIVLANAISEISQPVVREGLQHKQNG